MRTTTKPTTVYTGGSVRSEKSSIRPEDVAKVMSILTDRLYEDPVMAVIREYTCNALDAHISVGKADKPVVLGVPNELMPKFTVEDEGPGLSEEDVFGVAIQVGYSTKEDTNEVKGMFGLGFKSAYAYTDIFTVVSRHGGLKKTYSMHLMGKERGAALMATTAELQLLLSFLKETSQGEGLLASRAVKALSDLSQKNLALEPYAETEGGRSESHVWVGMPPGLEDEFCSWLENPLNAQAVSAVDTGITVSVPVAEKDFSEFEEKLVEFLSWVSAPYTVHRLDNWRLKEYRLKDAALLFPGVYSLRVRRRGTSVTVVMGNVAYPLSEEVSTELLSHVTSLIEDDIESLLKSKVHGGIGNWKAAVVRIADHVATTLEADHLVLLASIGDVEPHPSRETLVLNDATKSYLVDKVAKAAAAAADLGHKGIGDILDSAVSDGLAVLRYIESLPTGIAGFEKSLRSRIGSGNLDSVVDDLLYRSQLPELVRHIARYTGRPPPPHEKHFKGVWGVAAVFTVLGGTSILKPAPAPALAGPGGLTLLAGTLASLKNREVEDGRSFTETDYGGISRSLNGTEIAGKRGLKILTTKDHRRHDSLMAKHMSVRVSSVPALRVPLGAQGSLRPLPCHGSVLIVGDSSDPEEVVTKVRRVMPLLYPIEAAKALDEEGVDVTKWSAQKAAGLTSPEEDAQIRFVSEIAGLRAGNQLVSTRTLKTCGGLLPITAADLPRLASNEHYTNLLCASGVADRPPRSGEEARIAGKLMENLGGVTLPNMGHGYPPRKGSLTLSVSSLVRVRDTQGVLRTLMVGGGSYLGATDFYRVLIVPKGDDGALKEFLASIQECRPDMLVLRAAEVAKIYDVAREVRKMALTSLKAVDASSGSPAFVDSSNRSLWSDLVTKHEMDQARAAKKYSNDVFVLRGAISVPKGPSSVGTGLGRRASSAWKPAVDLTEEERRERVEHAQVIAVPIHRFLAGEVPDQSDAPDELQAWSRLLRSLALNSRDAVGGKASTKVHNLTVHALKCCLYASGVLPPDSPVTLLGVRPRYWEQFREDNPDIVTGLEFIEWALEEILSIEEGSPLYAFAQLLALRHVVMGETVPLSKQSQLDSHLAVTLRGGRDRMSRVPIEWTIHETEKLRRSHAGTWDLSWDRSPHSVLAPYPNNATSRYITDHSRVSLVDTRTFSRVETLFRGVAPTAVAIAAKVPATRKRAKKLGPLRGLVLSKVRSDDKLKRQITKVCVEEHARLLQLFKGKEDELLVLQALFAANADILIRNWLDTLAKKQQLEALTQEGEE